VSPDGEGRTETATHASPLQVQISLLEAQIQAARERLHFEADGAEAGADSWWNLPRRRRMEARLRRLRLAQQKLERLESELEKLRSAHDKKP
jgi:hypothetical protein